MTGPVIAGIVFVVVILLITVGIVLSTHVDQTPLQPGEEYYSTDWGRNTKKGAEVGAQTAVMAAPMVLM
jgi:hypothetical protein